MPEMALRLVIEQRNEARSLLRRLVAEFGLVYDGDGDEHCAYCGAWHWKSVSHEPDCAWLAAKRYLEGQRGA